MCNEGWKSVKGLVANDEMDFHARVILAKESANRRRSSWTPFVRIIRDDRAERMMAYRRRHDHAHIVD